MVSDGDNSGDVVGSLAWVIDRTNQEILGSMWMADNAAGITCGHVIIPYVNVQEGLQITFPATGYSCGVRALEFHPDFDRWMAKRVMNQMNLLPAYELIAQRENVVAVKLTSKLHNLDAAAIARVNAALTLPAQQEESLVSGHADRLELTSMLQTLVNARNYGTLVLTDERNRPIARMFLEDGKLTHAQYRNSINEMAVYRLITSQTRRFLFYFQPQVSATWTNFPPIQKSTTFLLMEAYRRMEEQTTLLTELGAGMTAAVRARPALDLAQIPEDFHYAAAMVFHLVDPEMPITCLCRCLSLDSFTILSALKLLVDTQHVLIEPRDPAEANSTLPLVMHENPALNLGDEVFALGIDPESRQAVIARSRVELQDWQGIPGHALHGISLPPELAGTPLVKDGAVIGTHCGIIPSLIQSAPGPFEPQMAVWSKSAYTCLGLMPAMHTTQDLPVLDPNYVPPEETPQPEPQPQPEPVGAQTFHTPQPIQKLSSFFSTIKNTVEGLTKPQPFSGRVFQASILKRSMNSDKFVKISDKGPFRAGDLVKLEIVLIEDSHVYVVHRVSKSGNLKVVFPYNKEGDKIYTKGSVLTVPERQTDTGKGQVITGKFFLPGIPIPGNPGEEILYLIFSKTEMGEMLFDEDSLEGTIENLQSLIKDSPGTQTGEFPAIGLNPEDVIKASSTGETVVITRLCLTHSV